MEFVTAELADIPELTRMRIDFVREDQGGLSPRDEQRMRQSLPAYFEAHLGRDLLAFVAKHNDRIISTAFLLLAERPANPRFIHGLTGQVLNVYTMPPYRRNGFSSRLLRVLIRCAQEHGLDYLELKATAQGLPLYRKLGFAEDSAEYTGMKLLLPERDGGE